MKQKIVLHFPSIVTEQPFTYYLIKEYNLMLNILRANINPRKEGRMVVEVSGDSKNYQEGMDYLQSRGVRISPLEQEIVWLEERCTQCGACVIICPVGALAMERPEMKVKFAGEKCIVCEHCIKSCPARAMEVRY